jgi:hypothetical protein
MMKLLSAVLFGTVGVASGVATMAEPPRRFRAPWRADKVPGGDVVQDASGQALAYVYSRDNGAEARQAKMLLVTFDIKTSPRNVQRVPEFVFRSNTARTSSPRACEH